MVSIVIIVNVIIREPFVSSIFFVSGYNLNIVFMDIETSKLAKYPEISLDSGCMIHKDFIFICLK